MSDIIIFSLPKTSLAGPSHALPTLKAAVESAGFSAFCWDLNLDLWLRCRNSKEDPWSLNWSVFEGPQDAFDNWWDKNVRPHESEWIQKITKLNPRYFGVSVLGYSNYKSAMHFCRFLKTHFPQIPVIVGGAGITSRPSNAYRAQNLISWNIADHVVVGEGEVALIELLKGNTTYPGIISKENIDTFLAPKSIENLDMFPDPDYSDFDFSKYINSDIYQFYPLDSYDFGLKTLFINGSRGCVRDCTFCNVRAIWPKFRYRDPDRIAAEMNSLYEKYGITRFVFNDSLINASIPVLKKLCESIIRYQNRHRIQFEWMAQAVCHSAKKQPAEIFDLLSAAGCQILSYGIESGSESVRNHMGKFFNNDDLWFCLEQSRRCNISFWALLIVGYPTETEADFQDTLGFVKRLADEGYLQNNIHQKKHCIGVNCYEGNVIFEGSPQEKIVFGEAGLPDLNASLNWGYQNSEGLNTLSLRIQRTKRLYEKCRELGIPVGPLEPEKLNSEVFKNKSVWTRDGLIEQV